jgi:hypothetical protein
MTTTRGPFDSGGGGNLDGNRPAHWQTSEEQCQRVEQQLNQPADENPSEPFQEAQS